MGREIKATLAPNEDCAWTQKQCQTFANNVWKDECPFAETPAPRVRVTARKTRFSSFHSATNEIKLAAAWGACGTTLCHELAHAIVRERNRDKSFGIASHGPQFVAVYLQLMEQELGFDPTIMRNIRIRHAVRSQ